jgi:hypothetical protein
MVIVYPLKSLRKQGFTVWEIWDMSQGLQGFENMWQMMLIVYLFSKNSENKVSHWKLDLGNCGRFNWNHLAWWEYNLVWWVDCKFCVVKFYYRVLIRLFTYLVSQDIMVWKHMSCKILNVRFVIHVEFSTLFYSSPNLLSHSSLFFSNQPQPD